jgi:hypothetical protein
MLAPANLAIVREFESIVLNNPNYIKYCQLGERGGVGSG